MPFCPKCRYEYVQGIEKCPDCDVELVWELPSEPPKPEDLWSNEAAVTVFTAKDGVEAEIVRGILEGAGIQCCVTPEITRYVRGLSTTQSLMPIEIKVLESKAWDAEKVIREAMEAGSDLPEEM